MEFDPFAFDSDDGGNEVKKQPVHKNKAMRTGRSFSKPVHKNRNASRSRSRSCSRSRNYSRSRSRNQSRSQNRSLRHSRESSTNKSERRSLWPDSTRLPASDDIDNYVLEFEEVSSNDEEDELSDIGLSAYVFENRALSKPEMIFLKINSLGLVKRFGGNWNNENPKPTLFELETHCGLNNFQYMLTDRLFRNISDIYKRNSIELEVGKQRMDEASQQLETAKNFKEFKNLISRFLKKLKKNANQLWIIAKYPLTERNSYGFALIVKAARAILNVASGDSTEEYTCFCKFCYDKSIL